jgi:hypothetical protein
MSKATIAALDDLIKRCEKSMLQPFSKKVMEETQEVSQEPSTIEDKLSEDESALAAFYESMGDEE